MEAERHADYVAPEYEVRTELRALRAIMRQVEKLSPASRRWLIDRLLDQGTESA